MLDVFAAESSNDLIKVVPGLMIWTLIAFGITFFVLKKYAFGPIQKTIDARRDRIREAVDEADNAREEARDLLEQNRAILAQARSESAHILAEARKVADAQVQRVKDESEVERQRRLEETRRQIEAETARAIDQIRGEVADLTLEATQRVVGKVLDADDQRRLIDEAVEGLDFSALERGKKLGSVAVVERLYARALFGAAEDQGRVEAVHRDLCGFADAVVGSPELAAFLANPQIEPATKASVLGELSDGADELVHNFLRLLAVKGRAGQIPGIRDEFQALVDRAQGRVAVELTTAFELSDDEAASIVAQIEKSSGRTVEATRNVDPELVGGMILQAGSLRVDASVRGRLQRLRAQLVTR